MPKPQYTMIYPRRVVLRFFLRLLGRFLMRLLTRFEKREQLRSRLADDRSSDVIQSKHIAWQEQQIARAAISH